jgi:lipopolysaccharide heptosyltransferase II
MKILVLALSGIGDALMYTPSLALIRKHYPDAQVDALVMFKGVEDIYKRTGFLNNVIYFDFMKEGAFRSFKFLLTLRGKYDYSINVYPSNRKEYNLIQRFINAKQRAGVDYLRKGKKQFSHMNNVRITEDDNMHNVEENILLTQKLLGFEDAQMPDLIFNLHDEDESAAQAEFQRLNLKNDDLIIGFHAGCSTLKNHIKRRWEPEKFAELAKKLITEHNAKVLLFGGPEEAELKKTIFDLAGIDGIYIPQTKNLAESAALIKKCSLFVTNDSSLMHVASAMKRKVVAIIGPTNISYIHPWQTEYTIATLELVCAPCFCYSPKPLECRRVDMEFKCIKMLDVERVYTAVKKYL